MLSREGFTVVEAADGGQAIRLLESAESYALIVLDQVSEADCGVVTKGVRERLASLGKAEASRFILADTQRRVALRKSQASLAA